MITQNPGALAVVVALGGAGQVGVITIFRMIESFGREAPDSTI